MTDFRELPLLQADQNWEKRREEIRKMLAEEMYGIIPEQDCSVSYSASSMGEGPYHCEEYQISVTGKGGTHTFPVRLWLPEDNGERHPLILHLWNRERAEDEAAPGTPEHPAADFLEKGYALAICLADDIEKDEAAGFPQGLAKAACGARGKNTAGALATWAYGLRLAAGILAEREDIDETRIAVGGCSRFGKAALWSSAVGEFFYAVASFDSGCGGAALNRGKRDEHITDMVRNFPHWLCLNMNQYVDREEEIPFDQHFLLALIAPRKLLVTSSTHDLWSDPYSEFLGLRYAQEAYQAYGKRTIDTWIWPPAGKLLMGEGSAYYLRKGEHGVTDEDWNAFRALIES